MMSFSISVDGLVHPYFFVILIMCRLLLLFLRFLLSFLGLVMTRVGTTACKHCVGMLEIRVEIQYGKPYNWGTCGRVVSAVWNWVCRPQATAV